MEVNLDDNKYYRILEGSQELGFSVKVFRSLKDPKIVFVKLALHS